MIRTLNQSALPPTRLSDRHHPISTPNYSCSRRSIVLFPPTHPDLIFLHAPSVYDFRKKSIVYGPVSDLVPSTPIFEMYPVGFSSISHYLRKHDLHVRIINIALPVS